MKPILKPWKLDIERTGKAHQFIIREQTEMPYVGIEIARINPYDVVKRNFNSRLIAEAPALYNIAALWLHELGETESDEEMQRVIESVLNRIGSEK